jgi:hypothetical protein
MAAGSPARAAAVYQALIARTPDDRGDYAGLGEAELEDGQYRGAHMAFFRAFLKNTNDPAIRARLELLNTVTGLDPTPRQLPTAEKYRRSLAILGMARASLEQCLAQSPGPPSTEVAQLESDADAAAKKRNARVTNEDAEEALGAAQKLWREKLKTCGDSAPNEEPLRLIMEKLAAA